MTTLSSELIQERALQIGAGLSSLQFLRSQKVAEEVADRVWTYLVSNGYGRLQREHTVRVKESERFPGTWMVRLTLRSGIRRPGAAEGYRRDEMAAEAAFKGAYAVGDLVSSYTHELPGRRR